MYFPGRGAGGLTRGDAFSDQPPSSHPTACLSAACQRSPPAKRRGHVRKTGTSARSCAPEPWVFGRSGAAHLAVARPCQLPRICLGEQNKLLRWEALQQRAYIGAGNAVSTETRPRSNPSAVVDARPGVLTWHGRWRWS